MNTSRLLALLTLGSLLGVATGCRPAVDGKKVEAAIKSQAATDKLDLTSVSCPATVPDKAGETFTCAAIDDLGTQANFTVSVTDPKSVSVAWKRTSSSKRWM